MLHEGKVYIISNATVKVANRKFTSINNDYCLGFHRNTNIKEVSDLGGRSIKKQGFSFVSIGELAKDKQDLSCDVVGIITDIGPEDSIMTKKGDTLAKRNFTLLDLSTLTTERLPPDQWGVKIGVTLWGEQTDFNH